MDMLSFGQWIRARREALDLKREMIAYRAGISTAHVRKLETGDRQPSMKVALQLAKALEIPDDEYPRFLQLARPEADVTWHVDPLAALPGGDAAAPALAPLVPLIGRERDRALVREYLLRPEVRLVTLTGAPGVGKTSLALTALADLQQAFAPAIDPVWLVPIKDPERVLATIGRALGLQELGQSVLDQIRTLFRRRHGLLLLDNFEHLLAAAPLLTTMLQVAPGLKVLVTSRIPLGLTGEYVIPVQPLPCPNRDMPLFEARLLDEPAVQLFMERARAVRPQFRLTPHNARWVVDICHMVDGLPLALELAAAHILSFSARDVRNRLANQLSTLTRPGADVPEHQRGLRTTLDWSYDLLGPQERQLLQQLAVFDGGCTVEALDTIWVKSPGTSLGEPLQALIRHHLVMRDEEDASGTVRITLIQPIREYARAKLDQDPAFAQEVLRRHALYYANLIERAALVSHPSQYLPADVFLQLEQEYENIHSTLVYFFNRGDHDYLAALCAKMRKFWWERGLRREGYTWMVKALEHIDEQQCLNDAATMSTYIQLLLGVSLTQRNQGDFNQGIQGIRKAERLLAQYKQHDRTLQELHVLLLNDLSFSLFFGGYFQDAIDLAQKALDFSQEDNNIPGIAQSTELLALIHILIGSDNNIIDSYMDKSFSIYKQLRDQRGCAKVMLHRGTARISQGAFKEAIVLLNEVVTLTRKIKATMMDFLDALTYLGFAYLYDQQVELAKERFKEVLQLRWVYGDIPGMIHCFEGLALVAFEQGRQNPARVDVAQLERAIRLSAAAMTLRERMELPLPPASAVILEQYRAALQVLLPAPQITAATLAGATAVQDLDATVLYALEEPAAGPAAG